MEHGLGIESLSERHLFALINFGCGSAASRTLRLPRESSLHVASSDDSGVSQRNKYQRDADKKATSGNDRGSVF